MKKYPLIIVTIVKYFLRCLIRWIRNVFNILSAVAINDNIWLSPQVEFSCDCASGFLFGSNVSISRGSVIILNEYKGRIPVYENKINRLIIGDRTYIGEFANIRAAGASILIGKNCMIAQHVTIVSSNHMMSLDSPMIDQNWQVPKSDIVIEDDVWIGAGAIILPGVRIGSGAVIAAGAVVSRSIGSREVFAGIPASLLKVRT